MTKKSMTVEFRLPPIGTAPKPPPGEKAERLRQERAARRARNLALAYWIDGLVRGGAVPDLAAVARMCGVSRARVSQVANALRPEKSTQEFASHCAQKAPSPDGAQL